MPQSLKINRPQFQILRIITNLKTIAIFILFSFFLLSVWLHCTHLTFCVGFHLSQGNSPLCGSSTGGCRIDMHKSPFYTEKEITFRPIFLILHPLVSIDMISLCLNDKLKFTYVTFGSLPNELCLCIYLYTKSILLYICAD